MTAPGTGRSQVAARHLLIAGLWGLSAAVRSQLPELPPSDAHDGRWSVVLVCADTRDKSGLVKGYDYHFDVAIVHGRIEGRYGAPGAPASVVYTGSVADDGTLDIEAAGNTGRSDYSVGKVAQGTKYEYTLHGRLDQASGSAVRRELRRCEASFSRQ